VNGNANCGIHGTAILQFKSNWETIKSRVTEGSIWGQLLFLLHINYLTLGINVDSKLLLYADDTSV
jgi:hypothetical protein